LKGLNEKKLESKGISQPASDIKRMFVREFPDFENAFDVLSSNEDFMSMLSDFGMCERELQKLSYLQGVQETYLNMKSELKAEIFQHIINHLKNNK
jgi:hypothetical protein